jgi:hypothetical protein
MNLIEQVKLIKTDALTKKRDELASTGRDIWGTPECAVILKQIDMIDAEINRRSK